MIRQAELRDITDIEPLFLKLMQYLIKKGHDYFNNDFNQLRNGIVAYLLYKVTDENSIILVNEKPDGRLKGFMIGCLVREPVFFKHQSMGRVEWNYPLSVGSRDMARKFEEWARERGATGMFNHALINNQKALKAMKYYGLNPTWFMLVKEFDR